MCRSSPDAHFSDSLNFRRSAELVRCLAPRLVALAVAEQASPAAELELWRLSPSKHTVLLFVVYACLGSPSIKSLHVSEFASFMNLVVPCLIKQLRNIRHAHAADVHVAHVLLCVHIWCRRTLIDCPQTVCTETPNVPHDPEGR